MGNKFLVIIFCILYSIANVSGAAVIKWKIKSQSLLSFNDWLQFLFSIPVILAFALIFASALIMFKALSLSNFSFVVPISTGVNFIFTIAAGYFLFKDKLDWVSFVGFAMILGGIIILALNNHQHA